MKKTIFSITLTAFGLALIIAACTKKQEAPSVNTVTEFSFPGGQFKDGKITVDPGVKVEQDPTTHKVSFMKPGGGAVTIDCVCSAGGGSCFPDPTTIGPSGPTIVVCVSIDPCARCDQFIFTDLFKFATTVATKR